MAPALQQQALAHYHRGCLLQGQQDWERAIVCYDQALALDPTLASAHSNRGAAFAALNRCDAALASLDRALSLRPDYPEAHFCKAVTLLLQGNFDSGWAEFEWRWQTAAGRRLRQSKNFEQPQWSGQRVPPGSTILLYCERGMGDTLQFCRYAQQVLQLGANVILQVQAPLLALLRQRLAGIDVISETEALPHFDLQCPLLSTPLAFKTSLHTIPAAPKLRRADPAKLAHWRTRLAKYRRPRVGLFWRGDAKNPDDRNRSVALRELLTRLPSQLHYVSLQKDITPQERSVIEEHAHCLIACDNLNFEDTAALCECVDLVISIDSSVAHLAASLGSQTWLLLPFNPDCRWMLEREDSPWYPSVGLYRQAHRGDWHGVLARVAAALAQLSSSN